MHPRGVKCGYTRGMQKVEKSSPTESPLLFEIDPEPAPETLTALGGMPLVVQTFRSLGLPASVKRHVQVKERERGYDEATYVVTGRDLCPQFSQDIFRPFSRIVVGFG